MATGSSNPGPDDATADVSGRAADEPKSAPVNAQAQVDALIAAEQAAAHEEAVHRAAVEQFPPASEIEPIKKGSIAVRYLGTSDRFNFGNDEDGNPVIAEAGGEPVKVTREVADSVKGLRFDIFEEVK